MSSAPLAGREWVELVRALPHEWLGITFKSQDLKLWPAGEVEELEAEWMAEVATPLLPDVK